MGELVKAGRLMKAKLEGKAIHLKEMALLKKPYPILSLYKWWIVPMLTIFTVILVTITAYSAKTIQEDIYLFLASGRAKGLSEGVMQQAPESWTRLLQGNTLSPSELDTLKLAFDLEIPEFNISKLNVYDLNRLTIFSTDTKLIGEIETDSLLTEVISKHKPFAALEKNAAGEDMYALFIPITVDSDTRFVFELYEPASHLRDILNKSIRPIIFYPFLFLIILISAMGVIAYKGQQDINQRTLTINRLRTTLESMVSKSALEAAIGDGKADSITSRMIDTTLFYSDIREFTSYAENRSPSEVFSFLNDIMGMQIDIIHKFQGDVDKMIGDAILAHFEGDDKEGRALEAAIAIQKLVKQAQFVCQLGIGIHSGMVIAGGIGHKDRQDFTIIGDAVNVAARLCKLAQKSEIVSDLGTIQCTTLGGFSGDEDIMIKGRKNKLKIARLVI